MVTRAKSRRRARGLTLIEVMIALLVTTIALLGALATVGITVRGANFSRTATEASVLAQSKLEQLVSTTPGKVGDALPTGGSEGNIDGNGSSNPPGIFTRSWVWSASGTLRSVIVTVQWNDPIVPTKIHYVYASRQQALQ